MPSLFSPFILNIYLYKKIGICILYAAVTSTLIAKMHTKCRNSFYPGSNVSRQTVSDEKVSWNIKWYEYKPPYYSSQVLVGKPWADPELNDANFKPLWNSLDGNINRDSYVGTYTISSNGAPLNPIGRTGITGRGVLGRWGPNHAADPIVTRWCRSKNGEKLLNSSTQLPILQFVAIERKDCKEWAIPGGMVDPGEVVTATLKREFLEEALNSLEKNDIDLEKTVKGFFNQGIEVYKGYVDDPRNTDNAWMETVACNFHDDDGQSVGKFSFEAGDDAQHVSWINLNSNLKLYASHAAILRQVARLQSAHW